MGVLVALVVALVAASVGPVLADEPVAAGWWYRLQSGLSPVAVPPPPDAPPDGLYVALDPSGPLAVAALSYAGSAGTQGGTLTLTFASAPSGTPSIDACVATAAVSGARAGAWETQPGHDCDAGRAEGSIAADGSSITFTLTAEFVTAAETIDAVLVPAGSAPFTAPMAKPGASSFTPVTTATDGGGFVPDDGASFGGDGGGGDVPVGDGGSFGGGDPLTPGDAFGGGSAPLPDGSPTGGGDATGGGADGGSGGIPVAGGPIDDAAEESQLAKTVAVGLLGLLGAAYWYLSNRAEPTPRLIGGLTYKRHAGLVSQDEIVPGSTPVVMAPATKAAHPVGGLGRFARPRENLPNRL